MHQHEAKNKALFIDKDGTLVPDVPYNVNPAYIWLQDGAGTALKLVQDRGYQIIIVTNQSGIAKGYFKEEEIQTVREQLMKLLKPYQVTLSGFYYCPHHPEGTVPALTITCDCRKPQVGLIRQATADLDIDLAQSWMIGDTREDVEAGKKAGCRTIFFEKRYETYAEQFQNEEMKPDYIIRNWKEIESLPISL